MRLEEADRKHWVSVAAAIVRRDGRILAIRRRDNKRWEPPGGTLELGETVLDGLRREVLEETGIPVNPGALSGVYKNVQRGIVALVFRCEHDGTPPTVTQEVEETRWMTPQEIRENLDPAYACRLLDALDESEIPIRAHDGISLLPHTGP